MILGKEIVLDFLSIVLGLILWKIFTVFCEWKGTFYDNNVIFKMISLIIFKLTIIIYSINYYSYLIVKLMILYYELLYYVRIYTMVDIK